MVKTSWGACNVLCFGDDMEQVYKWLHDGKLVMMIHYYEGDKLIAHH
jgi:hypothetical protein